MTMKKILEVEVIYDAFMDTLLGKLPRKEKDYPDWYKERLAKCDGCKFNTKNIPGSILPLSLYASKMIGKNRCSICGCFIKQKAWSKVEECTIGEGLKLPAWMPVSLARDMDKEQSKWNRLELITMDSDEFNLITVNDKKYNTNISPDGNSFQILLEPTNRGENIEFSFILESKHEIEIPQFKVSCGCTTPKLSILNPKRFRFDISLNTSKFGPGRFDKHLELYYQIKGDESKENKLIVLDFVGNIKNE